MRACLIDNERQTITEVEFDGTRRSILDLLNEPADYALDYTRSLGHFAEQGVDTICSSLRCLDDHKRDGRWFRVDAKWDPTTDRIYGRGLAVGYMSAGNYRDVYISIAALKERITFSGFRLHRAPLTGEESVP